jgi:hypothetical protein
VGFYTALASQAPSEYHAALYQAESISYVTTLG